MAPSDKIRWSDKALQEEFEYRLDKRLKLSDEFRRARFGRYRPGLGGLAVRLEAGSRQCFVAGTVKALSLQIYKRNQPPMLPHRIGFMLRVKPHECKWCLDHVMIVQGTCGQQPCSHGDGGCRNRCPFCGLPWYMFVLT